MSSSSPAEPRPCAPGVAGDRLSARMYNEAVQGAVADLRAHTHAAGTLPGAALDPTSQLQAAAVAAAQVTVGGAPLDQALRQAGAAAGKALALGQLVDRTGGRIQGDLRVRGDLSISGDLSVTGGLRVGGLGIPHGGAGQGVRFRTDEEIGGRMRRIGNVVPLQWVPAALTLQTPTRARLWILLQVAESIGTSSTRADRGAVDTWPTLERDGARYVLPPGPCRWEDLAARDAQAPAEGDVSPDRWTRGTGGTLHTVQRLVEVPAGSWTCATWVASTVDNTFYLRRLAVLALPLDGVP